MYTTPKNKPQQAFGEYEEDQGSQSDEMDLKEHKLHTILTHPPPYNSLELRPSSSNPSFL